MDESEVRGLMSSEGASDAFADTLNHLMQTKLNPETNKPWRPPQLARAMNEKFGPGTISAQYVWQLSKGRRVNPSRDRLILFAKFFQVPPSRFLGEEDEQAPEQPEQTEGSPVTSAAEQQVIDAMNDAGILKLAHRARGLSPDSLKSVLSMIEHVRHLEGLPDGEDPAGVRGDGQPRA